VQHTETNVDHAAILIFGTRFAFWHSIWSLESIYDLIPVFDRQKTIRRIYNSLYTCTFVANRPITNTEWPKTVGLCLYKFAI